jgi:hypothetical protein
MYAVFRRKFKPQPPQEVIIQEEPPAYSYGEQPGYLESPYGGGGYDPYAQTRQPPRPPSR